MSSRFPWGHIAALAIWISISVGIYLYFDARQKPTIAVAGAELAGSEVMIPRSRDGHYYVGGKINGHPVEFMVDTGASTVLINRGIARNAYLPRGMPATFHTANGAVMGEIVSAQTIEAGGIVVEGLSVGVGVQGDIALLGQNSCARWMFSSRAIKCYYESGPNDLGILSKVGSARVAILSLKRQIGQQLPIFWASRYTGSRQLPCGL